MKLVFTQLWPAPNWVGLYDQSNQSICCSWPVTQCHHSFPLDSGAALAGRDGGCPCGDPERQSSGSHVGCAVGATCAEETTQTESSSITKHTIIKYTTLCVNYDQSFHLMNPVSCWQASAAALLAEHAGNWRAKVCEWTLSPGHLETQHVNPAV